MDRCADLHEVLVDLAAREVVGLDRARGTRLCVTRGALLDHAGSASPATSCCRPATSGPSKATA